MNFKDNFYKNSIPKLQKELNIKNANAVPKLKSISVAVSIGSYLSSQSGKDYSAVVNNIAQITGQKPIVTKAKKAISNFKLREGMPVGVKVTLRKDRMYDFYNKLVNVILPRIRDFKGLPKKSFDGQGNFNIGIKEYAVFPEIHAEDLARNHGIQITLTTTAKNNEEGRVLLQEMGFPFRKDAPIEKIEVKSTK